MSLFQLGEFTLASGHKSNYKIDCDALTDDDIEALAALLSMICKPFNDVVGVPSGGLRIAEAMQAYINPAAPRGLVVDDVYTTGTSMRDFIQANAQYHGWHKAAIFQRGENAQSFTDATCLFVMRTIHV